MLDLKKKKKKHSHALTQRHFVLDGEMTPLRNKRNTKPLWHLLPAPSHDPGKKEVQKSANNTKPMINYTQS